MRARWLALALVAGCGAGDVGQDSAAGGTVVDGGGNDAPPSCTTCQR